MTLHRLARALIAAAILALLVYGAVACVRGCGMIGEFENNLKIR